jgi:hypothetical protein
MTLDVIERNSCLDEQTLLYIEKHGLIRIQL